MIAAGEPASVFLLAQNRLLREALGRTLHKKTDLTVVGAEAFSPLAAEQITAAAPDILVIDSLSRTDSELEFIRDAQRQILSLKVIVIGMDEDEQDFLQAIRAGVVGYVLKDASALEVVATIRAVASGEAVCPPELCMSLFRYVARQWNQVPSFQVRVSLGLTSREQQLVVLIGRGLTNKEIANQLQLAEQTVRNHVHRMLRKVGVNNRLAAVEMCRMQGLAV